MALPKIDVPIYEVRIPSSGKNIRFRPFTVKEEKLFLMAAQGDDTKTSINTIVQVLNNCILDDIDVEKMPLFDIEYLFLNLRARSISEVVELSYKCNNIVPDDSGTDKRCNNVVNINVNVLEIQPTIDPLHTTKIELSDKLGLVMRYPNMNFLNTDIAKDEFSIVIDLILDCIEYIYDDEAIYYSKDSTKEELTEFLDSLPSKDLEKIKSFFDTLPKMKKDLDFNCNKCGHNEKITLEGIESFFV
jgi:hypothetical protein